MADKKKNPVTEGKKSFNWPDKIFGAAVLILSILVFLIIAYPLWFIIIASISNSNMVNLGKVTFLPKDIRFYGYQQIMDDARIWMGYANTILYVVAGTILNMAVTMPAAYALSRRNFKARNKVMFYFVFTMFFSGGTVPTYLLIQNLGLYNSWWSLILPNAVTAYNVFVYRSFYKGISPEIREAARIDGAGDLKILTKIYVPLSKALYATFGLFSVAGVWNSYYEALLYIKDPGKQPIQMLLRKIVFTSGTANMADSQQMISNGAMNQLNVQYACVIATIGPILLVYPFIQKYFAQGMQVGAVKG